MKPTTMPRAAMETGAPASRVRPTPMPADGPDGQVEALAQLLRVEADARKAGNVRELAYLMVNETRGLARARQIFLLSRTAAGRPLQVTAVSSLAVVDRQVPLMQWIEPSGVIWFTATHPMLIARRFSMVHKHSRCSAFSIPLARVKHGVCMWHSALMAPNIRDESCAMFLFLKDYLSVKSSSTWDALC